MDAYKEKKFVCKFCSKRFACGKSLGGHVRTHTNENSFDSDEDEDSNLFKIDENGGQSSYGLRENPKKNKRFVDQRTSLMALKQQQHREQQELLRCRECGKGFVSSKALCGHMACHYEKEKTVMDSESDTDVSSSPIKKRSTRAVKNYHKAGFLLGGSSSNIIMNQSDSESSDDSKIEYEHQTAWSLIMLSKDSFKKEHNSVVNSRAELSDNNSVILETKSSSGEQLKILNLKNAEEEFRKKNKHVMENKLKSVENNGGILYDSDSSESSYFMNGPKKSDSSISFLTNKVVMSPGSRFESSTTKNDKNLNLFRNESFMERGSGSGSGRSSTKYDLRKTKIGSPSRKKMKYDFTESVYDNGDQCLETDYENTNRTIKSYNKPPMVKKPGGNTKKKSKGHECPICLRVFKSGQALGGHKRSHFIGSQDHRTLIIQHQVAREITTLIDLNLPAPIE